MIERTIKQLDELSMSRWDDYVMVSDQATFFHLSGWKSVLEKAFSHKAYFLYAEEDGEIAGILPLALVKSKLFGKSLSSLPFCVYGGIVATSTETHEALKGAACELAKDLKVDALELRNIELSDHQWPTKDLYVTFQKEISSDPEVNMKAIPSKQRTMIRKGIRNDLEGEFDRGYERIYRVYSESVRNLGTPVFSKNYFKVLREVFGENCDVFMVKHGGEDVAGVLSFYFKGQVLPYYGGSVEKARSIKGVNDFMYWELMCKAAERGCTIFDFGRSKVGTGPYKFKKNWGFQPNSLSYEYYLVGAKSVPEVNPNNPKYKYFINAWKKLPLPVANAVGPFLAKSLG